MGNVERGIGWAGGRNCTGRIRNVAWESGKWAMAEESCRILVLAGYSAGRVRGAESFGAASMCHLLAMYAAPTRRSFPFNLDPSNIFTWGAARFLEMENRCLLIEAWVDVSLAWNHLAPSVALAIVKTSGAEFGLAPVRRALYYPCLYRDKAIAR